MKTVYFLPCNCGRRHEVDPGQAGSKIVCTCGQALAVPSIRGLKQLDSTTESTAESPRARWNATRGTIFSLGLLLAVAAFIFAGYHTYLWWITQRLSDPVELALESLYAEVDALSPLDSLTRFRQEESMGLGEPSPPYWTAIDKRHEESGTRAILGIVVSGIGLLAAAGSMLGRSKKS